eukprot:15302677-Ditylum_brightwellii.AAC.2
MANMMQNQSNMFTPSVHNVQPYQNNSAAQQGMGHDQGSYVTAGHVVQTCNTANPIAKIQHRDTV